MSREFTDATSNSGGTKNGLDLASIMRGRDGAADQRDGEQLSLNSLTGARFAQLAKTSATDGTAPTPAATDGQMESAAGKGVAADAMTEGQRLSAKVASTANSRLGQDLRGDMADVVGPLGSGVAASRLLKEAGVDVGMQTWGGNIAKQLMEKGWQRTVMDTLDPGALRPGDVVRTSGNIGIISQDGQGLISHHTRANALGMSSVQMLQGRGPIEVYRPADHQK